MKNVNDKDFKLYKSNARVYTMSNYDKSKLGNNDYSLASKSGNHILTYNKRDIEYMHNILRQMLFEEYLPERSIEDEIFDNYELLACDNGNPMLYRAMIRKAKEDEIYASFRCLEDGNNIPLNTWFMSDEAKKNGSVVNFTPFCEPKPVEYEGEVFQLISFYKVPIESNENEKGVKQ